MGWGLGVENQSHGGKETPTERGQNKDCLIMRMHVCFSCVCGSGAGGDWCLSECTQKFYVPKPTSPQSILIPTQPIDHSMHAHSNQRAMASTQHKLDGPEATEAKPAEESTPLEPTTPPPATLPAATSPPPHLDTYLLLCVGGLEDEAEAATRAFLHRHATQSTQWTTRFRAHRLDQELRIGNAGCGKLILCTDAPLALILSMPFFTAVLAYVGEDHALPFEREAGLAHLYQVVEKAPNWDASMGLWARAQDAAAAAAGRPPPSWTARVQPDAPEPFGCKFRASVLRDGVHQYKMYDMSPVVGEAASHVLGDEHLKVAMRGFDLEVVALVLNEHVFVGLVLDNARTTFCSNLPSENVPPVVSKLDIMACLRPSTASLFLAMCQPRVGDVVADFMCGLGTLPLVAAITPFPQVLGLGGDLSEEAGVNLLQNAKYLRETMQGRIAADAPEGAGRTAVAAMLRWDAQRLPLRDGVVDIGIVDLPFGRRHKHKGGKMVHLYQRAFREFARVLHPGARLLLLATNASEVRHALTGPYCAGCWCMQGTSAGAINDVEQQPIEPRQVCIGGLRAVVFLMVRTSVSEATLPPVPSVRHQWQKLKKKQGPPQPAADVGVDSVA